MQGIIERLLMILLCSIVKRSLNKKNMYENVLTFSQKNLNRKVSKFLISFLFIVSIQKCSHGAEFKYFIIT